MTSLIIPRRPPYLFHQLSSCFAGAFRRTFATSSTLRAVETARQAPELHGQSPGDALQAKARHSCDRSALESLARRRLFYVPSFEIYGGVSGLYDFGPPGCALQNNIIDIWRKHFVLQDGMLEVDCAMLTPSDVLKTSGHVDKFADWMCKDLVTGELVRSDHLIKEVLSTRLKYDKEARMQANGESGLSISLKKRKDTEPKLEEFTVEEIKSILARVDSYGGHEMASVIEKYAIKNPATGNDISAPVPFNLMFQTSIGPSGSLPGYLRPETAQGQFLNFQRLLDFNQNEVPFASASIGKGFRNEISPRSGLLRVREFMMAEIEHFVHPEKKDHPRYAEVRDVELPFLSRKVQENGGNQCDRMTVGQAVQAGIIDNETLGYFLARVYLFLTKIGVDDSKLRFRQHMQREMAHYATDCWDAELLSSYGWIECVGCADRSAYDLTVHQKKTGSSMVVRKTRKEPLLIEQFQVTINRKAFGPKFKAHGKAIEQMLMSLSQQQLEVLSADLSREGKVHIKTDISDMPVLELDEHLVTVGKHKRVDNVVEYTPNVIEPSFGIGRILYCLLEHVFWTRSGDEARGVSLNHNRKESDWLSNK